MGIIEAHGYKKLREQELTSEFWIELIRRSFSEGFGQETIDQLVEREVLVSSFPRPGNAGLEEVMRPPHLPEHEAFADFIEPRSHHLAEFVSRSVVVLLTCIDFTN